MITIHYNVAALAVVRIWALPFFNSVYAIFFGLFVVLEYGSVAMRFGVAESDSFCYFLTDGIKSVALLFVRYFVHFWC